MAKKINLRGTHTKIKTLKRNCFGMKNFNLFRKRIMFACSSVRKTGNFRKALGVLFAVFIFSSISFILLLLFY